MSTDIVARLKAKAKINFFRATRKDKTELKMKMNTKKVVIGKNCGVAQIPAFLTRYM